MTQHLNYGRLAAPRGDGEILVEPPPGEWLALIEKNRAAQSQQSIRLAGRHVEEVRRAARAALKLPPARAGVVACGHQPAFVHPGVWAKHVVVRHMADAHELSALDLVVDNDAPGDSDLMVPVVRDGFVSTQRIAFSAGPAGSAYEGRPRLGALELSAIRTVARRLENLLEGCMFTTYLEGYDPPNAASDFVNQHVAGRQRVEDAFDAQLPEHRVSCCFGGPFAADLLLSAPSFAAAYNSALQAYRRAENVRSPDRPLPDLGRDGDRTEAALWIYKPLERRRRLWVERGGAGLRLLADEQPVGELDPEALANDPDAALASLAPWVIRPRALTLTLWARLLICDLFVHGIGGAKYDRVTDMIFRGYYGCEPPAMTCVSATLRLPLPQFPVTPADVQSAMRAMRDLRFNPQRYLSAPPADLLKQREQLIAQSRQLRAARADGLNRRRVFRAIREINARLVVSEQDLAEQFTRRTQTLRAQAESNAAAGSREYFYALQPRSRLEMLAKRLRIACSP